MTSALIALGAPLVQASTNATLVYDIPTNSICWLEKKAGTPPMVMTPAQLSGAMAGNCPQSYKWQRDSDFFQSGTIVRLLIIRYHFLSTFSVDINGKPIQPDLPVIRGIPAADKAAENVADTAQKKGSIVNVETDSALEMLTDYLTKLKGWRDALQNAEAEAQQKLEDAPAVGTTLLGVAPTGPISSPGFQLRRLAYYLTELLKKTNSLPARNDFVNAIEQTDIAIQSIKQFNQQPLLKPALDAFAGWATFDATAKTVQGNLDRLTNISKIKNHPFTP
jgi:hypothetical protein